MTKVDYKNKKFLSTEESKQQDLDYILETSALSLQSSITETKKSLKSAKQELLSLKQQYPLDIPQLCRCQETILARENALKFLQNLKKELGLEVPQS